MRPTTTRAASLGLFFVFSFFSAHVSAFRYDERYVGYNLNENPNANGPLEYWGKWENVSIHLFLPFPCDPILTTVTGCSCSASPVSRSISPPNFTVDLLLMGLPENSMTFIHRLTIGVFLFTLFS